MGKSLTEKKKARSMDKVLSDAQHYFEKNGYDNTSIDKLCDAAMISRSTFFNYFGSKEVIIKMVIEGGIQEFRDFAAEEMKKNDDPIECMWRCLDFQINATEKYKNISTVFYQLVLKYDDFKVIQRDFNNALGEVVFSSLKNAGYELTISENELSELVSGGYIETFMINDISELKPRMHEYIGRLIKLIAVKK